MDDSELNLLYPLSEFYLEAGLQVPTADVVHPDDIPAIYRDLLVHSEFMTPTLEAALQARIKLKVMKQHLRGTTLLRQVRLVLDQTNAAVELAAIAIYLDEFPKELQEVIVSGVEPLGTILRLSGFAGTCNPIGYFAFPSDVFLRNFLSVDDPPDLFYGRRATLNGSTGIPLADVVEILPALELLL